MAASFMDKAYTTGAFAASKPGEPTPFMPSKPIAKTAYTPSTPYKGVDSAKGQAAQTAWNEDMSSAGRLDMMLNKGGALMESARTRGNQMAARRGLMGSSMGIEAAQKAMIDSASPFAQTDASLYNQAARENTAQANQWDLSDLSRQQSDKQFGAKLSSDEGMFGAKLSSDEGMFGAKLASDEGMFGAKLASDETLAQANIGSQENMFGAKLASDEGMFGRELAEKARATDVDTSTKLTIAGMDYDLGERKLTQDQEQFVETHALEIEKVEAQIDQFAQELGLNREQLELRRDELSQDDRQYYDGLVLERDKLNQQGTQFAEELGLKKETLDTQTGLAERELDQNAEQFDRTLASKFEFESLLQENRIELESMQAENRTALVELESQFKADIAANDNIAGAWGTMMQQIGNIQNNPELGEDAKKTLIANSQFEFSQFAKFWKASTGAEVDLGGLLDFGPANDAPPTSGQGGGGENAAMPWNPNQVNG